MKLPDSDNVNSPTSPPLHCDCLLATSAVCFSSEMDEKLIELMPKFQELYDMPNKKYCDSVWKEKLWGRIGEELKKSSRPTGCSWLALQLYVCQMHCPTLRPVTQAYCKQPLPDLSSPCNTEIFFTFSISFLGFTSLLWDIKGIHSHRTTREGPICHCLYWNIFL